MTLTAVIGVVIVLFVMSEIALTLFKRSASLRADVRDRGSLRLIWLGVAVGVAGGVLAQSIPATCIYAPDWILEPVALAVLLAGLAVRWWAIIVLGRYFTANVAVEQQQPVIRTGPYRFVRHPSYAGSPVAFLGIGLFMSDWLSLVVLLVAIALVMLNRIAVEERALLATLGTPYAEYRTQTKESSPVSSDPLQDRRRFAIATP